MKKSYIFCNLRKKKKEYPLCIPKKEKERKIYILRIYTKRKKITIKERNILGVLIPPPGRGSGGGCCLYAKIMLFELESKRFKKVYESLTLGKECDSVYRGLNYYPHF